MATTTLKILAQTGITAVKAFTALTDTLAANGNATSVTYGATNTSLLTIVWTDLADGVYDCVYYAGAIAVGFDEITVSGVNTTVNEATAAAAADTFSYAVVERSPDDTNPIFFEWPNASDTLTVTVQKTSGGTTGSFAAAAGAATFVRTRTDGVHLWKLAYNVADRPTAEGLAVYKIVGTTYTTERELTLRVAVAGGSGGGGGSGIESDLMLSTTIASVTSQTELVLTAGSPDDNAYNIGQIVVITDSATAEQKARCLVSDYVGSTKTLTLAAAPLFVVAAGDAIAILAVGSGSSYVVGPGNDSVTIEIEDDGVPVSGVSVWITTDDAGLVIIAGTLITNGSGLVTFLLTAGVTYYLWAVKSGKVSILGQSFTAVAD